MSCLRRVQPARRAVSRILFDPLANHRLPCQDSRTFYGHRTNIDHAAVFRQQCDLPHIDYAHLAASHFAHQPADIRSGRPADNDAVRRGESVWTHVRLQHPSGGDGAPREHWRVALSTSRHVTGTTKSNKKLKTRMGRINMIHEFYPVHPVYPCKNVTLWNSCVHR